MPPTPQGPFLALALSGNVHPPPPPPSGSPVTDGESEARPKLEYRVSHWASGTGLCTVRVPEELARVPEERA